MPRLNAKRHPTAAQRIRGPVRSLNPTNALVAPERRSSPTAPSPPAAAGLASRGAADPGVYHLWRSRDNRKGRHAVIVSQETAAKHGVSHPNATNSLSQSMQGIAKMAFRYPVWDVSYDVAILFTIGSVIWVINGFFVWLPAQDPWTEFSGEVEVGGGITAFIGATVFEIGSVLLMLEAVNENRTQCFGWALEDALESHSLVLRPDPEECLHHHPQRRSLLATQGSKERTGRTWQWWPSWSELKTHYFHEIGFLACFFQLIGATVFWISGFTGLMPIYDSLSVPVGNGIFWLPQVVGGTGFIISSWLFMLETQTKWYKPAQDVLGWHLGFWNLVGALGFTICGALGFASENESAAYASSLATFIGSWAFLIGSAIQWFESLDKYPITVEKTSNKSLT
ncbi:hypothetical protein JX265_000544 [Neoarthrinium moseri]|uniref:Integral membrane protein n=1 Tax=Neoarthrinium moseri TaxID=1658444 RepID=A0A9Q0AV05_9PEZI|nr:hypothetical protein JX265_000544 [Neoarthrinium moseri]